MRRFTLFFTFIAVLAISLSFASAADIATTRPVDRYVFAQAMSKVKEGMSADEIKTLLGPPDDVRNENDPDGLGGWVNTKEIWRYGTSGHLSFPTLGTVYLDEKETAQYIYGGHDDPPPRGMFEEAQLREFLRIIDQSPEPAGGHFDPRKLIVAVNTLQPLGKEKALAALREYLRVSPDELGQHSQNVFLIFRSLFDVPADTGFIRSMALGAPIPDEPQDPKQIPRFPLAIVDDVPFMLIGGYLLGGVPESPSEELPDFQKNGRLRDNLMTPPDHPLELFDKVLKISDPITDDPNERQMVAQQLLWLVDTVYRPPFEKENEKLAGGYSKEFQPQWEQAKADLAKLDIRWDAKTNRYVFAKDGSTLPERTTKIYLRQVMHLKSLGEEGEVAVQREDNENVSLHLHLNVPEVSKITIKVITFPPGRPDQQTVAIEFSEGPTNEPEGDKLESRSVKLADGRQAILEVQIGLGSTTIHSTRTIRITSILQSLRRPA